ncbi:MAG TPA: serine hydrolase [Microscillaceae bacterium]|nr:serine hydrolase [Microscillaceae bacterium]
MNLATTIKLIILSVFISCTQTKPTNEESTSLPTNPLFGVWSGLLFQTQSPYDSLILRPKSSPQEALLYKNGKAASYPLVQKNKHFGFKGKGGLRFDATLAKGKSSLLGLITNNLWVQSLDFRQRDNQWVAKIVKPEIIDTDYQVYLAFYEDNLGRLQTRIQSNKENRRLHFTIDSTFIEGNNIRFSISNKRFGISAKHIPAQNLLILTYKNPGGKRAITLKKLRPDETLGYRPRIPKQAYTYQVPKVPDTAWQTASLEEVGISPTMLELMKVMNSGKYDHIHSVIVTKNNKLVFEEYFHGYHREYLHDIRSAFKSIASLLVGKTIAKDSTLRVDNPLLDYYPQYKIPEKSKQKITLHHALTMSTGLKLESEDDMQRKNPDWVKYKLNLPLEHEPGQKYQYSSGGMNLLSGVIQKSQSGYVPLFLYEQILQPLQIDKFQMRTSPMARAYLAGDFFLRPIDLAKFGQLVLNKGRWNHQQVIPAKWIETAIMPHIKGSWPKNSDYGYLWRLLERKVGGKKMKTIEAWGNGGQFLIIIPEVNMTVTFTGGNYNLFPEMENKPFEILNQYILPAVNLNTRK